jgi:plastocyanin
VAIYTDESATTSLFTGELVTGPKTITYKVPALPAGNYYFRCDVHPQMFGTFVVK